MQLDTCHLEQNNILCVIFIHPFPFTLYIMDNKYVYKRTGYMCEQRMLTYLVYRIICAGAYAIMLYILQLGKHFLEGGA